MGRGLTPSLKSRADRHHLFYTHADKLPIGEQQSTTRRPSRA